VVLVNFSQFMEGHTAGGPVHAFASPERYSGASEPVHAPHGLPRRRPRSR
jgi:hypothetical protein